MSNKAMLSVFPRDVLDMIQRGKPGWEQHVPERVAELIKSRKLFRYREAA